MTAARENEIGLARCPVCSSERARLRVSAKNLAYVTCDSCNAQVFARSDRSDEKLRAMHKAKPVEDPPDPVDDAPPKARPVAPITPQPSAARPGWGAMSWG